MAFLKVRYVFRLILLAVLGWASTVLFHHLTKSCCVDRNPHPGSLTLRAVEEPSNLPIPSITESSDVVIEKTKGTKRGYVLGIVFNGQQSVGIRSLTSMQCWIGSFKLPMHVVEPFLDETFVYGITSKLNTMALRLSDFFDICRYNERTKELGHAQLTTWEDFVHNAPRNVIVIRTRRNCREERPEVVWVANDNKHCSNSSQSTIAKTLLRDKGFCIRKVVKFYLLCEDNIIFSGEDLYTYIFDDFKPEEVTLLVDYWTGAWHVPASLDVPLDSRCRDSHEFGLSGKLYPSQRLLRHSQRYENTHTSDGTRFSVAVMIHSEHLLLYLDPKSVHVDFNHCVNGVFRFLKQDPTQQPRKEPFVTIDIGKFGSRSQVASYYHFKGGKKAVVQKLKELTINVFGRRNLTFEEWEETFPTSAEGITDRGYIAALQRTIASRADCLVLVGGGQFIKTALHQYLNLHTDSNRWCIYFVCVLEKFREEYYEQTIAQKDSLHENKNT